MFENLRDVSIYVGGSCNFDCKYCDRSYVKSVGIQKFEADDHAIDFIVQIFESGAAPMISFHGGETLVYINVIQTLIEKLLNRLPKFPTYFFIQTNGSLILKNKEFFEKYRDKIFVSISYDFSFQSINRTDFNIHKTLAFLQSLEIGIQLQYVIPTNNKRAFDVDTFASIVKLYRAYKITSLDLILLRHIRHLHNFETVIANPEIDIPQLFRSFIQFVELLYVAGINVVIDGHTSEIDKEYYSNHKQLVLAPNGLILPEYQFIEYKHDEFAIGRWKPPFELQRDEFPAEASDKMRDECKNCQHKKMCGLQYYYAMFDIDPPSPEKCKLFYTLNELSVMHLYKLKQHPSLLHCVGV